jgi:hypothetical protein
MIGLAAALTAGGCSEPKFYPTRGQIIVFGVGPLKEGEIRIRPNSKPSLIATGKIQKDGTFSVTTEGHGEGALEGPCQVAIIVEPKGGKRSIAERYGDFDTAELNFTIGPRVENYLQLDVKK